MFSSPYTLTLPPQPTLLIVSSPHSGRDYDCFAFACPLPRLRQAEDWLVDELVSGAVEAGAALLTATVPRACIDLNRAADDLDPAVLDGPWPTPLQPGPLTLRGLGLVRRLCRDGTPVYAAPLAVTAVQKRVETIYRPYHATLARLLAERVERCGHALLIDAHSMPALALATYQPRPDFVIGDLAGHSSSQAFTVLLRETLRGMGYHVVLNDPYRGQEILRRHGDPAGGRHALQLEINRGLYMDEAALEKTAGFERLQADLTVAFRRMAVN